MFSILKEDILLLDKILKRSKRSVKKIREENKNAFFESLWQQYPRREGKKEALRHYIASVKTEQEQQAIQKALNNYKIKIDKEKIESKYIMHGSSWFNNWRDYVDYQPPAPTRAEILREMGIRP